MGEVLELKQAEQEVLPEKVILPQDLIGGKNQVMMVSWERTC